MGDSIIILKGGKNWYDDEYNTPMIYWRNIKHLIPKDKTIWEGFYGNGKSAEYIKKLGKDPNICLLTNPPYTRFRKILEALVNTTIPFCLLIPISKISMIENQQYLKKMNIQIIIPNQYSGFVKDGKQLPNPPFYCVYLTRGFNLKKDILFLPNMSCITRGRPPKLAEGELQKDYCKDCKIKIDECECIEPNIIL